MLLVVAVLELVAGAVVAREALVAKSLSPTARRWWAAASLGAGVVWASLLAVFAYLIPVLVAIYDELRQARSEQASRFWMPGPPHGGWGYGAPPGPR